ncbi:MAG: TonB-dependent receptor [gamma proteobacterium symbiont of Taylorina sp.]|nr:TonB-dependent receptor [gamma proteobacterium symbiont of Taylorina sp.]
MKLVFNDNKSAQTLSIMIACCAVFASFIPVAAYPEYTELEASIMQEISLEGLYELPLIDIATGYAVPLEKAPSVATIITADDIKAMGALTLDEVLEAVPGLHASPSTLTAATIFSIRGIQTTQTPQILILLNGYRISSDVASSIFPSSGIINVQNISRIEVVRGPGSAVYGADAFAGVINIVTKSSRDIDGFQAGVRGGSLSTKNIWGQYGGEFAGGWRLAINLEHMIQQADKSRKVSSDSQSGLDALFGTSASLTPSYLDRRYESTTYNLHLNNDHWKVGLDGWIQRDIGQGAGIAQAIDHKGYADIDQMLFTTEYSTEDWIKDLKLTGKFSYQIVKQQYKLNIFPAGNISLIGADGNLFTAPFNPVAFPDGVIGNPGRKSTTPQLDVTFLYNGLDAHTSRFNLGIKKEELEANESKNFGSGVIDGTEGVVDGSLTDVTGTDFVYISDEKRTVKYLSFQDVWEIGIDWTLTAGVRYDDYSDFGGTTNPRVALVWTPTADIVSKLLYGRAFRAPSFVELYTQNNPVTLGNPKLKPETIDTFEWALSYEPVHNIKTDLSIYQYKTKDMIDFIDNGDGSKTAQNAYNLKGQGVELEGQWKINKQWSLLANYAYQETINEETNLQQPFIPKQQFYFDARWTFLPDWTASTQFNWVGHRKREVGDERPEIDDYTLVNLSLRKTNIAKNWEIAAAIKNVFDEEIYEPSDGKISDDYPMNERSAFIEIRYHLSSN